jgi:hypothetical protein
MNTAHLSRLGAVEMPRNEFVARLERCCNLPDAPGGWADGQFHFPSAPSPNGSQSLADEHDH